MVSDACPTCLPKRITKFDFNITHPAIALDGSSNVWISHVTTSLIGRQHIVTGNTKNTGVTISDHFINGTTPWSASCNSYHYWALFMTGEFDTITFKNNYIYHTGGRAPKLGGAAVVHMANNYWDDIDGHAFEGENAYALVEGNVFENVKIPIMPDNTAAIYTPVADDAACEAALGRPCVVNSLVGSSGEFRGVDASAYSHVGKSAVDVAAASEIEGIPGTAGNTL
jgi:pectin lyase